MSEPDPSQQVPYQLAQRLIKLSLIFGAIGGLVGGYILLRYLPGFVPTDKRQTVLQESSAVVDVVKSVSPSVVSITSEQTTTGFFGQTQTATGSGTGIIVSEDGLIMTNKHVVPDGSAQVSVFTSDGKEHKNASVVARDPLNDIAFVRISAHGLKPAAIGDSSAVVVGQKVVAIGNALGQFQNTATEGIVSGLGRPVTAGDAQGSESLQNLIQTDAAINPGNSGGPLVNLNGQVIGMNTAVAGNAQNIGFAIPINEVRADIASVKAQGKIAKPYLGVRYVAVTPEIASSQGLKTSSGALVTGGQTAAAVVAGSPAERAGLKAGDIITKIGGDTIDQGHSLTSLIQQHSIGDKLSLTVVRGDQTLNIEVTLAEAK